MARHAGNVGSKQVGCYLLLESPFLDKQESEDKYFEVDGKSVGR